MQVVIDIPKANYEKMKTMDEKGALENPYLMAIAQGTPLPKGHGNLKDIDKIISVGISKGFCDWYDEMKYADTIIEADKAEGSDKE